MAWKTAPTVTVTSVRLTFGANPSASLTYTIDSGEGNVSGGESVALTSTETADLQKVLDKWFTKIGTETGLATEWAS